MEMIVMNNINIKISRIGSSGGSTFMIDDMINGTMTEEPQTIRRKSFNFNYPDGKDINEALSDLYGTFELYDFDESMIIHRFHADYNYYYILEQEGDDLIEKCYNALLNAHCPEYEDSYLDTLNSLYYDG